MRGYRFVNPFLEGHGRGGGERKEKKGEEERIGQWVSSSSLSVETMPSPPRGGGLDLANMVAAAAAACHAEEKKGDTPFMKRNFGAGPHWNWRQATRAPEVRENRRITEAFELKIN